MSYTDKSWSATMGDLRTCFQKWGVRNGQWNVDCALTPARAANVNQTKEQRTVRLWWKREHRDVELTIDKWPRAVDNLRALYLTVDSIRLNEYRGVADEVRQVYAQIAPPNLPKLTDRRVAYATTPWAILGAAEGAPIEIAEAAYKVLARRYHPDNRETGNEEKFLQIQNAINIIKQGDHHAG